VTPKRGIAVAVRAVAAGLLLIWGPAACAPRLAPAPVVTVPRYPDFMFPTIPPEWSARPSSEQHQRAWQFLQAGDLRTAARGFDAALKIAPTFYPAEAGLGYVGMAEKEYGEAISRFDRALAESPAYVPALIGRGDALLASSRESEAISAFERAIAADRSLTAIQRRVDLLKFRLVQQRVEDARKAASAGNVAAARQAYAEAIQASPDSALLYRELAALDLQEKDLAAVRKHLDVAIALDPNDARAHVLMGEMHEMAGDLPAALAAYDRAQTIEATEAVAARMDAVRVRARLASLPREYAAIRETAAISRSDLAALIGVRLGDLVKATGKGQAAVVTDTRGHWAASWILAVTGARIMDVYPNHTFQPQALVRRNELTEVVSRLLTAIGTRDPALAERWRQARVQFTDLGAGHLSYAAASRAVAAGVLPVLENNTFQLGRQVSGAEALAAIDRLEALANSAAAGRFDE
jgi:tetratricopeptide (TPR) repeat protein